MKYKSLCVIDKIKEGKNYCYKRKDLTLRLEYINFIFKVLFFFFSFKEHFTEIGFKKILLINFLVGGVEIYSFIFFSVVLLPGGISKTFRGMKKNKSYLIKKRCC